MSAVASWRSLAAILLVVVAAHASLVPKVSDLDAFYHVGHAAAYVDGSPFDTSLPWATKSIIGERGGDIWWGLHAVLIPFSLFEDPADGVRTAAIVFTTLLALGVFWILRRHGVAEAGIWTALLLVAVPNILYQFVAVRPHVLTALASLALLSVLVRGRWWHALLAAACITWLHLGFFWMPAGIVCAYGIARVLGLPLDDDPVGQDARVPLGPAFAAVLAGSVLGWLLRPDPLEAAAIANVQIFVLFGEKLAGGTVQQVNEMVPLPLPELARTSWAYLSLWLAALVLGLRQAFSNRLADLPAPERTLFVTTGLISLTFVGLALLAARRAQVQWVAFGFVLLPLAWVYLLTARTRRRVAPVLALVLIGHVAWGVRRHAINVDLVAFPGNALQEAAHFLEENSRPGDVVYHARWDNFGPLFAHNRTNRYIGGMDPIFQFAFDEELYWVHAHLAMDRNPEQACPAPACPPQEGVDTHTVLRDGFDARWVLTEPRRNPLLTLYFLNDPRYRLALETPREAVFEVLP